MKITASALLVLLLSNTSCQGFVVVSPKTTTTTTTTTSSSSSLFATSNQQDDEQLNNNNNNNKEKNNPFANAIASNMVGFAVATSVLWSSPAMLFSTLPSSMQNNNNNNNMMPSSSSIVAMAKEKASGSGARVNKDADSLLRLGLPITNKEVRKLQTDIENINIDLGSKRKAAALDGVKKVKTQLVSNNKALTSMVNACRPDAKCETFVQNMDPLLSELSLKIAASQDAFTGSEQERTAIDGAYKAWNTLQQELTNLEEGMVPAGYRTPVPSEYSDLPQLQGRATVEFVIKKGPDTVGVFNINGNNYPEAKMTMVIDGYVAPITGGNFIELVQKGFYNNMNIQRSDGFVVQTGDPDGEAVGYTGGTPSKAVGAGPKGERLVPLEIMPLKDYPGQEALYERNIDEDGRGGEATVLPFSSYGAMGWAREEYSPNSGSSQFFWLLFDSDLTPAGKNLLDGNYPCFGYVVKGADFLQDVKEGDIITSAKVTQGVNNLKLP
mmetsp:Transcript_32276/g.49073  ORF Transcript_32276/g.49073 Transcript_32276/m.49073 type:complete len:496 (-) Transcript_32276:73-1560(-)